MATNKYSDLLEGLNTKSSGGGGRYDDLYLDLLSEEDRKRLQYRYQYTNPEEVGPPVEEPVGLGDILAEGFGTLKAVPSAGLAAYQGSQSQAIDEANQASWGQALLDFSRMNPMTAINKAASSLQPEMMQDRRNEFAQDQAANLQTALDIGTKEAAEVEALKQRYMEQGGSQFAADLAAGVGGSATSAAPLIGAVAAGAAMRSPRAALLAQQALAPIPAVQAYAQSYAEFKRQYPDASEEEAQNYAKASAGLEYVFEALPAGVGKFAGTGLGQAATEAAKRVGREALFETATEANQQLLQRGIAPELAPDTATDAAYNMALAGATAGVLSGPITVAGVRGEQNRNVEEARLQEQKRLAELRAVDEKLAEGAAVAQQQEAVRQAELAIAELNNLTEKALNRKAEQPKAEEKAPVQETITFPEQVPLQRDIFGNEVEARVMIPPSEIETQAANLEAEAPVREAQRLADARKVYVQDLNAAKSELTKARNEVTKFNKADRPVPQDVLDRAEAASLRVREAEFTLGRFDRLSKRGAAKGATTPAPVPQTAPTAPLTRAERVAQAAVPATTTTDVLDPATGRTAEQVAETAIAPNDPERVAIEQRILRDAQQAAATNRSIDPRLMEAANRVLNRTVAPEQRQATPLRQVLSRATTAWDALAGVRAAVSRGADPKIERYDRLIQVLSTPDMKDVEFSVLQPETEARTESQRRVKEGRGLDAFTKGIHEIDRATGKQSVTITGDGYASRDGTATVETTLHEIVHAKTAKAVADVKAGRETNERVVKAVRDFEAVRGEVRKADRKDLSREEAEAIDYATTNTDEFLSGTMTNPLVQSALKKEGFWKRAVNTIRIMLGVPRSQKNVLDEVLDAAYAVVDAVNAKESKPVGDAEGGVQRSVTQPTSNRERILGKGTKTRPMRTTQVGMFVDRVSRRVDSWLSAHKGGTKETTEAQSKAQGVIQRTLAELQVAVARMDRQLHSIRIGPRAELARQYLNAKPDDKPAIAQKIGDEKLVAALDRSRSIIDNLSNRLRIELVSSYAGKDMPQSTLNLLKTIERNLGTYTTRAYLVDLEPGAARTLWGDYKRGDAQAKERLQPLVDMVTGKLEGLSDWIEGARQEAELLSSTRLQFDPEETQFGRELRQRYGDFIGNPGSKTKAEMFRDLEKFASDLKKEDFDKQRDNAVQKMLGVFEDNGTADALSAYYRGMRGDDRTLRQRENVPPELRKAWGEILDPILTVQLTANRAAAALAGIQSSNYMVDEFPNLFSSSVDGDTNRIKQIPNNGVAYGKAAGMYTTPEVFEFMTASAATLSLFDTSKDATGKILGAAKWTIGAARTVTSYAKLNMIAFNITTQTVLSTLNFVAMPLTNGHFNLKRLPEAIKLSKRLVGTSYRTSDISPELLEIIEQGVVDPVQLRVDEEARSQEKENRLLVSSLQGGNIAQQWLGALRGRKNQVVSHVIEPLRETVSFFEVAPKVFNFLAAKDELKAAYPEMSNAEAARLAAEQTNRLNPTYARTRNIVGATETLGVSYTANYMEQIASTTARSLKMGYDQAKLGIQTGDTPLALMGLRKLMGVASVAGLSYALPGMIQAAFGLGESEEDELIKANLPFVERGMQPVIIDSDGEFIRYFDAGRLNPYDTVHAPMRAILSAVANLTSGNTEEANRDLEGATKNLAGQFAGGSPLGQTIVSLATNTPRTNTLENDLPGLYSWLVTAAGGDKRAAGLASSAYVMGTPSIGRSFISTLSRYLKEEPGEDREAFVEDKVNSLTAIGVPVRTANANQNMTFQASSMARARTEASTNLGNILLVPGNLSDEDIEAAVDDYLTSQLEPFAQAKQVVEARRALGRRQGESQRVTDAAIRETLKAERVDGNTIESLLSDNPFTPKPLSESFSELRAQRRAQRDSQRSERARLEALYNERIEKAQRMVNERVRSWSSENN